MELALLPPDPQAEIGKFMEMLSTKFRVAHQEWSATRQATAAAIEEFQHALHNALKDEPDIAEIDAAIGQMGEVVQELDGRLADYLQQAIDEQDIEKRRGLKDLALGALADYQDYISDHPYLPLIDTNEFMPMPVYSRLVSSLAKVEETLK
jgi:hypothetical protein